MKMETFKILPVVLFISGLSVAAYGQAHDHSNMNMVQPAAKTESFKVSGKCNMCKTRIEKAVKEEGATYASWNSKTQLLAVTYDPSKTSKDAFSKKLASVGHDTEKFKATDKAYNSLPDCCKYERIR